MTDSIMAFISCLRKEGLSEDIDFLREASGFMFQQLIDLEAEGVIGAGPYERTPERVNHRISWLHVSPREAPTQVINRTLSTGCGFPLRRQPRCITSAN